MPRRRLLDPNRTPEEVAAHVDEIIARNTKKDPICIVCQRPVTSQQTLIDTIHGAYHGDPMTCMYGRE